MHMVLHRSRLLLVIACGVVAVFIYDYLWKIGTQTIAEKIEGGVLLSLHKRWIDAGKPIIFDPDEHVKSTCSQYFMSTNTYMNMGQVIRSVFTVNSSRFIEQGQMFISDDGVLYWNSAKGKIRDVKGK